MESKEYIELNDVDNCQDGEIAEDAEATRVVEQEDAVLGNGATSNCQDGEIAEDAEATRVVEQEDAVLGNGATSNNADLTGGGDTELRTKDGQMLDATEDPGDVYATEDRDVLTDEKCRVATEMLEDTENGECPNDEETMSGHSERFPGDKSKEQVMGDGESCGVPTNNHETKEEPAFDEGMVLEDIAEPENNRRLSLKRSRSSYFDDTPSVQIIYRCLTSESKKKLKELLRQWAEWHGNCVGSIGEADKDFLENGDEMYFPALQVGGESKSTMPFWMDKPSKQARTERSVYENKLSDSQDREGEVPLYDRADTGALVSQETELSMEGCLELPEEVSRCFNCGSYSHSLKECPRPRDNNAINNARKMLSQKRGSTGGPRTASRYYQSSPGGKFDDLKPGILGSETRQSLGIGDLDPPPWLNRMRELGYPPGYLDDLEDEPSGITIFGTNEDATDVSYTGEDGEIIENGGVARKVSLSKKMTVSFPGVNAPIPDNADERIWASWPGAGGYAHSSVTSTSVQKSSGRRTAFSSSYSAAAVTSDGMEYTGSGDWGSMSDVSPGAGHEALVKSPRVWSPIVEGAGGNMKGSPRPAPTGSPHLNRSLSDSGRKSPKVAYDEPHSLPPFSGHTLASRQSGLSHSPRAYHSPHPGGPFMQSPGQRTPYGQEFRDEISDARRRAWAQAQEALAASRHNDRYSPASRRR